ncbi:MAG TPA: type II secretion system F family protein [Gemmatimonadota bacterium]|jgi:tight adherence protein C
MLYLATILAAVSTMLLVFGVGFLAAQPRVVRQRLKGVRAAGDDFVFDGDRSGTRARIEAVLQCLGEKLTREEAVAESTGEFLRRAGYFHANAVPIYVAARFSLTIAFALIMGVSADLFGWPSILVVLTAAGAAIVGWMIPRVFVYHRTTARRKEIQRSLPDALDLMVVCVESGMGLNQAVLQVSEEIGPVSRAMRTELALLNLEIQTGTQRDEALRNFAERTDLPDVRSLVAMLVQTDRFGTSIARSLRLHAETMRAKRRQRAEEAAAKTQIKLVFPLVLFIFPAMFVVILGPALLHIIQQLRDVA